MPVYEYECESGHRTERVKSIRVSDKELDSDKCDTCHKKAKLVPSRPGMSILVGAGFHANDYGAYFNSPRCGGLSWSERELRRLQAERGAT